MGTDAPTFPPLYLPLYLNYMYFQSYVTKKNSLMGRWMNKGKSKKCPS